MMKRLALMLLMMILLASAFGTAGVPANSGGDVERFPPPDFDQGYTLPGTGTPSPRAEVMAWIDTGMLVLALILASWLAIGKRSRKGLFVVMLACLAYFGFYREGCVCPIGAIQNVTLALFDGDYVLSPFVIAFFLLPLLATLFFGRSFCAAVCPLGAIQDLMLLRAVPVPRPLREALGLLAWIYLGLAVWLAATGAAFVICQYDPFVGIFRLSATWNMTVLGVVFLLLSIFVGRPYCRFLCPYGALLRLMSLLSRWRVKITPAECVDCRLCGESCPFDAIDAPSGAGPGRSSGARSVRPDSRDRKRLVAILVGTLILAGAGFLLGGRMGDPFSRMHPEVRLAERLHLEETGGAEGRTEASRAFRNLGLPLSEAYLAAQDTREDFVLGGRLFGVFVGLLVGFKLLGLSRASRREGYEANRAGCLACGRCFDACPVELERRRGTEVLSEAPEGEGAIVAPRYGHKAARITAWAAGIFCFLVADFLTTHYLTHLPEQAGDEAGSVQALAPLNAEELARERTLLTRNPRDEVRLARVRALDLEARRAYFEAAAFRRRGLWLLIVGALVFVLSAKSALARRRGPPLPGDEPEGTGPLSAGVVRSRHAVGGLYAAVMLGMVLLAFAPGTRLDLPEAGSAAYRGDGATSATGTGGGTEGGPVGAGSAEEGAGLSGVHSTGASRGFPTAEEIATQWPRFRGPGGLGVSSHANLPETWDVTTGEGIRWKVEVPLPGHNSPVVWGDRVFCSGADGRRKSVFCFAAATGELLWEGAVNRAPGNRGVELEIWEDTGYAASTVACDGRRVYVIFVDGDAAAFDMAGRRLWARNLGTPDNAYGYATSLTFFEDRLLIQYDQGEMEDEQSFLFALRGDTGEDVYKKHRDVAGAWTTPILIPGERGPVLVTLSDPFVIAYDPKTGDEIWRADLMGTDVAPSPIFAGGLVIAIQPYEAMYAIRPGGEGDVTETHVAWTVEGAMPDIATPVSDGELIYLLSTMGTLTCHEAATGDRVWEEELNAGFQASPSLAGGWILLISDDGTVRRVKPGRVFEEGPTSSMGETVKASPAFGPGCIYVRGEKHLFAVGRAE